MKKISEFFLSETFQFLEVKLSIYLNRRVFVMLYARGCSRLLTDVGARYKAYWSIHATYNADRGMCFLKTADW